MTKAAVALQAHPLSELVPAMSKLEYKQLREDIAENGQQTPITLFEGKILDGRHRARACQEIGMDPWTLDYQGDDPARYVISLNVHRRHLSITQRAIIAVEAMPHFKAEANRRMVEGGARGGRAEGGGPLSTPLPKALARDAAASTVGVSGRTVDRLKRVKEQAPDLYKAVADGKLAAKTAEDELEKRTNGAKPNPAVALDEMSSRQRNVANGEKRRVETLVGTCAGLARSLPDMKITQAIAIASPEELQIWKAQITKAESALRAFRKRVDRGGHA